MVYDVAIIGAGPAGVSAGIYAQRYMLNTVVIAKDMGGMSSKAWKIENYAGIKSVVGKDLGQMFMEHFNHLGVPLVKNTVASISKEGKIYTIAMQNSEKIEAKSVIFCQGTKKRKLNLPKEDTLKGICYCAICDGPLFRNRTVIVAGGNDSGATAALLLSEYAKKIYLVERLPSMPCEKIWFNQVQSKDFIEIICNTSIKELVGETRFQGVVLTDGRTINADGLFVEIGSDPDIALAKSIGVEVDQYNCIKVDAAMKTNLPGVYAAGDITNGSNYLRQVATAVGEGAVAAYSIFKEFKKGEL